MELLKSLSTHQLVNIGILTLYSLAVVIQVYVAMTDPARKKNKK